MKTNINNKDTYVPPFVMTLVRILRPHCGTSFGEFCLLQVKASCSRQNAVSFDIIKEEIDFTFGPPATTCLVKVFCGAGGGKSVVIGSGS